MADVSWQFVLRRCPLAKVMDQDGKANDRIIAEPGRKLQRHHHVYATVDFRVPFWILGNAKQRFQFREQDRQRTAIPQNLEKNLRARFQQGGMRFLPYPFCHQCIRLAVGDHAAHQLHGFFGDREAGIREARREARDPQQANRVLFEGRRDVAQFLFFQVFAPATGIDQFPPAIDRHRIDGQVPALQILYQGHIG